MNDPVMLAKNAAIEADDVARRCGTWPHTLDHLGIMSARHKTDVLAVVLFRNWQAKPACQFAGLRLGLVTQWKTQMFELRLSRCEQEVALVALRLAGPK